jgi:CheY-like chemotaxis protein
MGLVVVNYNLVTPNEKKRILVVEDQPMVADALKLVLRMDG